MGSATLWPLAYLGEGGGGERPLFPYGKKSHWATRVVFVLLFLIKSWWWCSNVPQNELNARLTFVTGVCMCVCVGGGGWRWGGGWGGWVFEL